MDIRHDALTTPSFDAIVPKLLLTRFDGGVALDFGHVEKEFLAFVGLVGDETVLAFDRIDSSADEVLAGRDRHRPLPVCQHASPNLETSRGVIRSEIMI